MYNIGDLIIYGGEGVCRVEDIGCPDIPSLDRGRKYYTLSPLYREGKTYTPVDTSIFMRRVISREEAQQIIRQIPAIHMNICEDKNMRSLTEHYEGALQTYDCTHLVQLIKSVYVKRQLVAEKGKKLGQIDERYMKRAEDMLHGELAVALGIPKDEVRDYIAKSIPDGQNNSAVAAS